MRLTFETVAEYEAALKVAIDEAMQGVVTENAKKAIADSVTSHVYSKEPKFLSRDYDRGGLQDPSLMNDRYDSGTKTLTIEMTTPWQHLYGGAYPSADLADVVEHNNIYSMKPRKFMEPAEQEYASAQFKNDLLAALRWAGL